MATYLERALKQVLEGEYDSNEHRTGRYHVVMKWDGYSAMVDISYLHANGRHDYEICQWDSLEKRILIDEDNVNDGQRRKKVIHAIHAIQNLGYKLNLVQAEEYTDKPHVELVDRTTTFQQHIA